MSRGHRGYYFYRDWFKVWNRCQPVPETPKYFLDAVSSSSQYLFWIKAIASFKMQTLTTCWVGGAEGDGMVSCFSCSLVWFPLTPHNFMWISKSSPSHTDIGSIKRKRKSETKRRSHCQGEPSWEWDDKPWMPAQQELQGMPWKEEESYAGRQESFTKRLLPVHTVSRDEIFFFVLLCLVTYTFLYPTPIHLK